MEHKIIFKDKTRYASFPLISKIDDGKLLLGFFSAPVPDHCGLYDWEQRYSDDEGDTWEEVPEDQSTIYSFPAISARHNSDRLIVSYKENITEVGCIGFYIDYKKHPSKITESVGFHHGIHSTMKKENKLKFSTLPTHIGTTNLLTFPRHFVDVEENIVLIPAYALIKGSSRAMVLRSSDKGETFKLWNMFPDDIQGNEMAFIRTKHGILAHIRSDKSNTLMESWSEDNGLTWSHPTCIYLKSEFNKGGFVIGSPPHLLRLRDGRIICTYGYRNKPMGIRAIVSEDDGYTWNKMVFLRYDGGYRSSLYKKKKFKKLPPPTNDIGYPVSIQLKDDSILTVYYITNEDQITHIASTKWRVEIE